MLITVDNIESNVEDCGKLDADFLTLWKTIQRKSILFRDMVYMCSLKRRFNRISKVKKLVLHTTELCN